MPTMKLKWVVMSVLSVSLLVDVSYKKVPMKSQLQLNVAIKQGLIFTDEALFWEVSPF